MIDSTVSVDTITAFISKLGEMDYQALEVNFIIFKPLKRHSKAKRRAPAYSRALENSIQTTRLLNHLKILLCHAVLTNLTVSGKSKLSANFLSERRSSGQTSTRIKFLWLCLSVGRVPRVTLEGYFALQNSCCFPQN